MKQLVCLLFFICFSLSFSALYAQEKATPKRGEGISVFLERNKRPGRQYYKEFMELNKKKLGKDKTLKLGMTYVLPPLKKKPQTSSSSKQMTSGKQTSSTDKQKTSTDKQRRSADKQTATSGKQEASSTNGKSNAIASNADSTSSDTTSTDMLTAEQLADSADNETPDDETDDTPLFTSQRRVSPSRIYEPLFGKALADVKVTSKRLAGTCFYVVGEHGGPDPGAIGRVGKVELHEDEYAYDIALRLARNLMQEGAEVRIIIQDAKDGIRDQFYLNNSKRETCMGSPIPLSQVQRLKQRCTKINALYRRDRKNYTYCRAIFIHLDSRSKKQQTDVFFYHAMNDNASKKLAQTMRNTFEAKYKHYQPGRGFSGTVSGRNLYVLANTKPTSAFVELGNIQNSFDQKRFIMSSNRQALANWLCDGFITDFKQRK